MMSAVRGPSQVRGGARRASARGALVAALVAVAMLLAPRRAASQDLQRAVRFQIAAVGDSTFTFNVGGAKWVRVGARGIAIDPRRRDALVARFEVLRLEKGGAATALITGETMRLTVDHFAVLEEPKMPWFAQRPFWLGTVLGLLVGAGVASH